MKSKIVTAALIAGIAFTAFIKENKKILGSELKTSRTCQDWTTDKVLPYSQYIFNTMNGAEFGYPGNLNAHTGACGGFSFASLDYFFANTPVFGESFGKSNNRWLYNFINYRHKIHVDLNWAKHTAWAMNPDDGALRYWSTHDEWNKLVGLIDEGKPCALGLAAPSHYVGDHHTVVAIGYAISNTGDKKIYIYDNNCACLRQLYNSAKRKFWAELHFEGANLSRKLEWRGFFVETYNSHQPPITEEEKDTWGKKF
jgi:hypothetical protein